MWYDACTSSAHIHGMLVLHPHNVSMCALPMHVRSMAAEEFSEAWRTKAAKRRLQGLGDWGDLQLRTVFVDPPRSGLDDKVRG